MPIKCIRIAKDSKNQDSKEGKMVDIVIPSIISATPIPTGRGSAKNPESLRGRILSVRDGRKKKRRLKSVPFNKTIKERRCKQEPRKDISEQDNSTSKILVFHIDSNSDLTNLIGKDIALRVINP